MKELKTPPALFEIKAKPVDFSKWRLQQEPWTPIPNGKAKAGDHIKVINLETGEYYKIQIIYVGVGRCACKQLVKP
jgi:hypothetical protein